MTNNYKNSIWLAVFAATIFLIQSCGIPNATRKSVENNLPTSFQTSSTADTTNTANVNWNDFFEDAYLTALIDSAMVNNYEINILLQRINRSQNEIQARTGEYLPFVNIGGEAGVEKVGKFTRNGAVEESLNIEEDKAFPEPLGDFELGVYASWELDIWKKLRNSKKIAVMEYLAGVEGRNFLRTNLISEIASAYYELIALDNKIAILEQNLEIQRNAIEVVQALQQAGRANSLAVKRFEAELKKNESEVFKIKQEIVETENEINFLVGRNPQSVARKSNDFINFQPKPIRLGVPSQLLQNRPDIRQAELELQAADLNIEVARANFYPSIGLKAGIGTEAFHPKLLFNPESLLFSLVGEAVAPLINKRAIQAAYNNANAMQIEKAYEYEQTMLDAYIEVSNQLSNIDNLEKSWALQNAQVEALNESIEIVNQLFQSTRAEYIEVLLTQRDALEAKLDLVETKKEQLLVMVGLYKSLGGGWR